MNVVNFTKGWQMQLFSNASKNSLKLLVTLIAATLISTSAFAEDRVIEESLVYDDPTVAKQSQWIYGGSIDFHDVINSQAQVFDTNGYVHSSSTTYNQLGASAFIGYGDFSLLTSYKQGTGSMIIPAYTNPNGSYFGGNSWNFKSSGVEFDLRWLITQLQSTYFVPYALIGYSSGQETDTFPNYFINGVQEVNTSNSTASIAGIGGIIPITSSFGLRADIRKAFINATVSSTVPAFNGLTMTANGDAYTLTGYYNFTQNINAQLGYSSESIEGQSNSTNSGVYAMLGYTFR